MITPITFIIIGITVIVSYLAWENNALFNRLALHPYVVKYNNQWDRIFGHTFVHADWMHLGFNMYTFYSFGQVMEWVLTHPDILAQTNPHFHPWSPLMGKIFYVLLYFIGGAIACIPAILKHSNQYAYRSVGASGAVSAVMMAFMLIFPDMEVGFFMIIPMPAWVGAIIFLGLEHYFSKKGHGLIAHDAHLYGALGGAIMVAVWDWHFYLHFFQVVFNDLFVH